MLHQVSHDSTWVKGLCSQVGPWVISETNREAGLPAGVQPLFLERILQGEGGRNRRGEEIRRRTEGP